MERGGGKGESLTQQPGGENPHRLVGERESAGGEGESHQPGRFPPPGCCVGEAPRHKDFSFGLVGGKDPSI